MASSKLFTIKVEIDPYLLLKQWYLKAYAEADVKVTSSWFQKMEAIARMSDTSGMPGCAAHGIGQSPDGACHHPPVQPQLAVHDRRKPHG